MESKDRLVYVLRTLLIVFVSGLIVGYIGLNVTQNLILWFGLVFSLGTVFLGLNSISFTLQSQDKGTSSGKSVFSGRKKRHLFEALLILATLGFLVGAGLFQLLLFDFREYYDGWWILPFIIILIALMILMKKTRIKLQKGLSEKIK